jgi:hypothetical protein
MHAWLHAMRVSATCAMHALERKIRTGAAEMGDQLCTQIRNGLAETAVHNLSVTGGNRQRRSYGCHRAIIVSNRQAGLTKREMWR